MAEHTKARAKLRALIKRLQAGIGAEGKGQGQPKGFKFNALRPGSGPKAKAKARLRFLIKRLKAGIGAEGKGQGQAKVFN